MGIVPAGSTTPEAGSLGIAPSGLAMVEAGLRGVAPAGLATFEAGLPGMVPAGLVILEAGPRGIAPTGLTILDAGFPGVVPAGLVRPVLAGSSAEALGAQKPVNPATTKPIHSLFTGRTLPPHGRPSVISRVNVRKNQVLGLQIRSPDRGGQTGCSRPGKR